MSLFTRTMMLLCLMALMLSFGVGLREANDKSPTDTDRFVAARNYRRAIAYRQVDYVGGQVGRPDAGTNMIYSDSITEEPQRVGAKIESKFSLAAMEAYKANILEKDLTAERDRLEAGGKDANGVNQPSIADLMNQIADEHRKDRANTAKLKLIEGRVRVFANEIDSYSYMIQSFQQKIFNLDYEVQIAIIERNALLAEQAQVVANAGRIIADTSTIEDHNADTNKEYARVARLLGDYDTRDPELRAWAARVGNPWLRGVVMRAHEDSRIGTVWISIGEQDGVKSGQLFSIHRGNQFVGRMRVESVERNGAVGRLTEEFRGMAQVRAYDRIRATANLGNAIYGKN